jgi:type I protein arginine methyltransferase
MQPFESAQTSYEGFYQMLSDDIRMQAYQKAIFQQVKTGDTVLDLGAGTGILSFLALKAGAKKVYLVEKTDSIQLAKIIAEKNGFSGQIEFLQQNSKQVALDEKVDIIISETLGSFAVDENTLDFILDARLRLLKEGGILLPSQIKLHLAPINVPEIYKKVTFWKQISGIDFSPAFDVFSRKIMIEDIHKKSLLSSAVEFSDLNLYAINQPDLQNKIHFKINKKGTIHGVAGWFDLSLTENIRLTTSPNNPLTHWKQAFFPFQQPIEVIQGDMMEFTLQVSAAEKNSDNTKITYDYRCTQLANEQSAKPARNSPCPCGSGKKYKQCCESLKA